jgi:sulfur carrier protein
MRIQLNGAPLELPAGATLADAVRMSGAAEDGRGLAVALDGEVVARGGWGEISLREGQRVEVLTAIQGGEAAAGFAIAFSRKQEDDARWS